MISPRIGQSELKQREGLISSAFANVGILCLCLVLATCTQGNDLDLEVILPTDNPTLLEGPGSMLAVDALQAQLGIAAPANEQSETLIFSRMAVLLEETATVDQVNEALEEHEAFIVSMRPGFPVLNLKIPLQSDANTLESFRQALIGEEAFADALIAFKPSFNELPAAGSPPQHRHHATTRAIAAWNARAVATRCAPGSFTVMVIDRFKTGTVDPKLAQAGFQMLLGGAGDPLLSHGDRVASLIAASLHTGAPYATNPAPHCHNFYGVQVHNVGLLDTLLRFRSALDQSSGEVVANLSWGFQPRQSVRDRASYAAFYRYMFDADIESGRLLTVSSVGNDRNNANLEPGAKLAQYDSPTNIESFAHDEYAFVTDATLFPTTFLSDAQYERFAQNRIVRFDLVGAAPITNNIPVGSLDAAGTSISPAGAEPSSFSNRGARLFAPGEGIEVLGGTQRSGTSYAAPQVSGLIAYLWALSPELRAASAQTTINLLVASKNLEVASHNDVPIISAYNAILSLESGRALSAQNTPVRLALLDVDDNNRFDEDDLLYFVENGAASTVDIEQEGVETYARVDLNGDGQTGIGSKTLFDASSNDSPQFGEANISRVTVQIGDREQEFDELEMDDRDILCFYAYSPLYSGSESARQEVVGDTCGESESECSPNRIRCMPTYGSYDYSRRVYPFTGTRCELQHWTGEQCWIQVAFCNSNGTCESVYRNEWVDDFGDCGSVRLALISHLSSAPFILEDLASTVDEYPTWIAEQPHLTEECGENSRGRGLCRRIILIGGTSPHSDGTCF
jgi:subtilisin family serine protease